MQSECTAITPQFICSYAWKQPPVRPAIFQRAQKLLSRASESAGTDAETEHQSVSWKAYLAARERQHLASDIVEGFFNASEGGEPEQRRQARDPVVQGVRQGLAVVHPAARSHRAGTCVSRFHGRAVYRSLTTDICPLPMNALLGGEVYYYGSFRALDFFD